MFKNILLILISFSIGYGIYPYLNPASHKASDEFLHLLKTFLAQEASRYADADSADKKLQAADAMYERMMVLFLSQLDVAGPENIPVKFASGKALIEFSPAGKIMHPPLQVEEKVLSIAEKIFEDKLDPKTFQQFSRSPYLNILDSRITKLNGSFIGKLKPSLPNRTGEDEAITFDVNGQSNEGMTKLKATDSYDNVTLEFNELTSRSFRSIPGDENLIILMLPNLRSVVLDLKHFPKITGRILSINKVTGQIDMRMKPK